MSDILKKILESLTKPQEVLDSDHQLLGRGPVIFQEGERPQVLFAISRLVQNSRFPNWSDWDRRFLERYPNNSPDFLADTPELERKLMWYMSLYSHYSPRSHLTRLSLEEVRNVLVWPKFNGAGYSVDYFFPSADKLKVHSDAYFSKKIPNRERAKVAISEDILLCKRKGINVVVSPEASE